MVAEELVYADVDGGWGWWVVEGGSPTGRVYPLADVPPTPTPKGDWVYCEADGGWTPPSWLP